LPDLMSNMSYIRHMIATMAIELENLLKPTNFSPLYQQIKSLILEALEAGQWKPGEMIPSEVDLASKYKVSQGTVRKAIDELSLENFLVRRQGKGTFVSTHQEDQVQYRFLRLAADDGQSVQTLSKTVFCANQLAPAQIANSLNLPRNAEVIHIRRLLLVLGNPVVFEDIWLPGEVFSGLSTEVLVNWKGPMYALFESEFGVHMVRATEKLKAVKANLICEEFLEVTAGSPLLSVERVSFTYADKPVEVRQAFYSTENHHYFNEMS
jgi:GntR family transcriptional regulator